MCIRDRFQDADFASLSGARVVRIAVHPEYARMGYGARALEQLEIFYECALLDPDAHAEKVARDASRPATTRTELGGREPKSLPPLLERLSERQPESLDRLGRTSGRRLRCRHRCYCSRSCLKDAKCCHSAQFTETER